MVFLEHVCIQHLPTHVLLYISTKPFYYFQALLFLESSRFYFVRNPIPAQAMEKKTNIPHSNSILLKFANSKFPAFN